MIQTYACLFACKMTLGVVQIPDSIIVRYLDSYTRNESFWHKNAVAIVSPIITLLVSITSIIVTYLVTNRNIKSSRENLERQLAHQTQQLRLQIASQERNLDRQLNLEYQKTVLKEWKQQIIDIMSEMVKWWDTLSDLEANEFDRRIELTTNIIQSTAILELYLDSDNDEEEALLDAITDFGNIVSEINYNEDNADDAFDNMIRAAHNLFNTRNEELHSEEIN